MVKDFENNLSYSLYTYVDYFDDCYFNKSKIKMHVFIVWKTILNLLLLYDIWY